ncbi:MAG: hypothetical protein CVU41_17895 [Chloroflexi bacterium HGW-Chloroflexi-3]|nr:MAG: hypothetical protein CVU41_17895 [Chloroflexi bacterium HGW-Chloroflexi-3]
MLSSTHSRILTNLPWLGLLLLIILSITILLPVLPNDFWWYLRLGQDILTTNSVPLVDNYSSTVFGQSVSYPMWLSAVLLYALYNLGDLTLVVFSRGLMISVFYIFLWLICVKKGAPGWLATVLTLVCALAGANNWAVRPQMFVYPLFGFALYLFSTTSGNKEKSGKEFVDEYLKENNQTDEFSNKYYWLIPIALFWANLHGSVIVLFFLMGPFFLFRQRNKKFVFVLLLAFLATFVNPRGPILWLETVQFIQSSGIQFSQEWKPPTNSGWQMNIFFLWFLVFIPLVKFSSNKLKIHEWIWLMGFGWMAFSGVRHVVWFLALLLIFSSWLLQGLVKRKFNGIRFEIITFNIILLVILSLLPLSLLPGIREYWWKQSPQSISQNTTITAAAWLNQHPELPGPIFNDYVYGSYLIFTIPERPVWIDTRFHIYPSQQWEEYLSISNAEPGWLEKLKENKIGTLFLDNSSQKNLIQEMKKSSTFCEVYNDEIAVIFSICK